MKRNSRPGHSKSYQMRILAVSMLAFAGLLAFPRAASACDAEDMSSIRTTMQQCFDTFWGDLATSTPEEARANGIVSRGMTEDKLITVVLGFLSCPVESPATIHEWDTCTSDRPDAVMELAHQVYSWPPGSGSQ